MGKARLKGGDLQPALKEGLLDTRLKETLSDVLKFIFIRNLDTEARTSGREGGRHCQYNKASELQTG